LYGSNVSKLVFLPVRPNPAGQVRLVDFLRRVTAPRIVLCEFALREMITELSYRHCAGIHWPGTGVDFRDQSHYYSPRSILVRVLLNGADDLLMVKTHAVKANLGPAKLPDIRASFASLSFQTSTLHLCPPAPPLRSRRIFGYCGWGRGGKQTSELFCGGSSLR